LFIRWKGALFPFQKKELPVLELLSSRIAIRFAITLAGWIGLTGRWSTSAIISQPLFLDVLGQKRKNEREKKERMEYTVHNYQSKRLDSW
jgi:hypothetical protein